MSDPSRTRMTNGIVAALLAIACTCPAYAAQGDTLAQLRTTLKGLESTAPLHGVLHVQSHTTVGKGDDAKQHAAKLRLAIRTGKGLAMQASPALLRKVEAEKNASAADPNRPTPTADLLGQTDLPTVHGMVAAAPMLLRMLADARSPHVEAAQLYGQPVQELTVTLPKPTGGASVDLDDYNASVSVWIGADGTPRAYAYSVHAKGCKFFLCMRFEQSESGSLRVVNGRLVAVKQVNDHKQSGLGQDRQSHTVYTLDLARTEGQVTPASAATAP